MNQTFNTDARWEEMGEYQPFELIGEGAKLVVSNGIGGSPGFSSTIFGGGGGGGRLPFSL